MIAYKMIVYKMIAYKITACYYDSFHFDLPKSIIFKSHEVNLSHNKPARDSNFEPLNSPNLIRCD
jgi:hypothetical protein